MRIVLDAMGSDDFPAPDVEGAVLAAREYGITVVLVGDRAKIDAELAKHNTTGLNLEVIHTDQTVTMEDKPSAIVRSKPNSSIHIGLGLVEEGKGDAFVSCGNTGAVLAVATLQKVKRIRGVQKPTLAAVVLMNGKKVLLSDIGANADCKPEHLLQFAIMANIYAQRAMQVSNPRVALLSNGEEEGKGNELLHQSVPLFKEAKHLNYVGNVEPKEVVQGKVDIVISDGFAGNIFIKAMEATGDLLFKTIRAEAKTNPVAMVGGLLLKPTLKKMYRRFDPFEIGGAVLLGVNGVVIVGHGRSNGYAVKNALRQAKEAVEYGVVQAISEGLKE